MVGAAGARSAATEGERWARRELEELRAAHFTPPAVQGFLAASFRRVAFHREARPDLARQSRRWGAVGALFWTALAGAGVEPFRSRVWTGLTGWSATWLMVDWHLGMVETPDGRPRPLGPADALTVARGWLAPAVAARPAPALLAAGLLTDVLDGPLARAGEPTRFGRDLDGLADAYFGIAAVSGARRVGALPPLVARLELARVGVGVAAATVVWFGRAAPPERSVLAAARPLTPLRAAGLFLAAAGRRRAGAAFLVAGSLGGCALSARTLLAAR